MYVQKKGVSLRGYLSILQAVDENGYSAMDGNAMERSVNGQEGETQPRGDGDRGTWNAYQAFGCDKLFLTQ